MEQLKAKTIQWLCWMLCLTAVQNAAVRACLLVDSLEREREEKRKLGFEQADNSRRLSDDDLVLALTYHFSDADSSEWR